MSESSAGPPRPNPRRTAQVLILGGVMFTFISFWRTAAVVLCDLASTVYYIGGIVEHAVGPAAPWFILGVMLFSYAVRSVYLESCSLFVRGGVYKVVKEAMGGFLAKLSVSALMFDYVLTGPTSGVSAGQYIMGLVLQYVSLIAPEWYKSAQLDQQSPGQFGEQLIRWGSVGLAALVTVYFYRQNLRGIHESSGKALKIMYATTAMAVIILVWCGVTLVVRGPSQSVPFWPDLNPKVEHLEVPVEQSPDRSRFTPQEEAVWVRDTSRQDRLAPKLDESGQPVLKQNDAVEEIAQVTGLEVKKPDDPLGFMGYFRFFGFVRAAGVIGLFLAFGHSILAMSGEETLAQVYREVESPKMRNFKRAAFIVFVYSILLTAGISFLAVLIIPDEVRMKFYSGNLISGLARHVVGPSLLKLALETFVVVIGFMILAGAVNTAIIGSNGVLNRISEDGVLPDWFLKPHPKFGTTYRLLTLIAGLQLGVIFLSMGHILVLGEAYAFGVVWSFVFKALSMVVLRFKDKTPREYRVPFNVRVGGVEIPLGLIAIFFVLLMAALLNFMTKEVATVSGMVFTIVFLTIFVLSERRNLRRLGETHHEHLEQFNLQTADAVSLSSLKLDRPYHKLVSIRSTQNLFMLEKALAETDPDTTDVVVMTAKVLRDESASHVGELDSYSQHLMTAVVERAEKAGKEVRPLIVPTNNPLHAILNSARELRANELILGASNIHPTDEQLEQIALYWFNLHDGQTPPLTVRLLGRDRDVHMDLGGGSRIPKMTERKAKTVAELRAAGLGVSRVLLLHDGSPDASDLFRAVLTALDPEVVLDFARPEVSNQSGVQLLEHDVEQARKIGREIGVLPLPAAWGDYVVQLVKERSYGMVILGEGDEIQARSVRKHAACPVLMATLPAIPTEASAE